IGIALRGAIANGDTELVFRLIDDATPAEKQAVLADAVLIRQLRKYCTDPTAWDRVYKTLSGQADLADALPARTRRWLGADSKGMQRDIQDYLARRRVAHLRAINRRMPNLPPQ